jgi:hypothetical protein
MNSLGGLTFSDWQKKLIFFFFFYWVF